MAKPTPCTHSTLLFEPSPFAELAGFQRPDQRARIAATTKSGRAPPAARIKSKTAASLNKEAQKESQTYPGPLVLPHDALNYDPDGDEPAQSFRSWLHEKQRNKVTPERRTLYVGAPPSIDQRVSFMKGWTTPNPVAKPASSEPLSKRQRMDKETKATTPSPSQSPGVDETIAYLRAFYHGLNVKPLPIDLRWTSWEQSGTKKRTVQTVNGVPKFVALSYGDRATRVRARPVPDGAFGAQLNLDDILDAAIAMLPHDAYAMVLLVDHDIYESADDDFCAGRAYGGSRVSVVQSARYNPLLDSSAGITRDHAWPASHCKTYIDSLCAVEDVQAKPATATQTCLSKNGPMRAAVDAVSKLVISDSKVNLEALWSSRVIRTVSHELGHCLCLAHCFFYACIMQSTASLLEDVRQAPYLCPTCDAKTSHTIVVELQRGTEEDRQRWVRDRYSALKTFCEGDNRMEATLWAGFHGWLGAVLENRDG
jgi:archaemetzincin